MPPVASNSPFRLRMRINLMGSRRGWTEDYWMVSADPATTLARAERLSWRRVLWLATNFRLEYASLSRAAPSSDSFMCDLDGVQTYPLQFNPTQPLPSPANDLESGWEFRLQTANKRWANRILRGVSDDWVRDIKAAPVGSALLNPVGAFAGFSLLNYQVPVDANGAYALSLAGTTLAAQQLEFLQGLVTYTGVVNVIPPGSDAKGQNREAWTVTPFTQCKFNQVSSHRTGQGFGAGRARSKKRV